MKYLVTVVETLEKTVEVEADNAIDAEEIVKDMYHKDDFELDYSNLVSTEFEAKESKND